MKEALFSLARGLAAKDFDPATDDLMPHVADLCLQGLVGIMDPPYPEARKLGARLLLRRQYQTQRDMSGESRR